MAYTASPLAAFAVYAGAMLWANQSDLNHYLLAFDSPTRWLDSTEMAVCLIPVLPLALIHAFTPRARQFWLWIAWGLIAGISAYSVLDSFGDLNTKLRSMAISIVVLPVLTMPITVLAALLAWRSRIVSKLKSLVS